MIRKRYHCWMIWHEVDGHLSGPIWLPARQKPDDALLPRQAPAPGRYASCADPPLGKWVRAPWLDENGNFHGDNYSDDVGHIGHPFHFPEPRR